MRTIQQMVDEIKSREKQELLDAVYKYGESVDSGFEVRFEDERPVVAGYIGEDPCDIIVEAVFLSYDGEISIEGFDKNNAFCRYKDIEPGDIFAGHLDFLTSNIV